jgi:hypothetical protein
MLWNFSKPVSPASNTIFSVSGTDRKNACQTGQPQIAMLVPIVTTTVAAAATNARQ